MFLYRSFCGCESARRIVRVINACLTSASVVLLSFEDGKSNLTFVPVVLSSIEDGKSNLTFHPMRRLAITPKME